MSITVKNYKIVDAASGNFLCASNSEKLLNTWLQNNPDFKIDSAVRDQSNVTIKVVNQKS